MISFKPSMSFHQSPQLKNSFPLTSADKCLSFLYTLLAGTKTTDFQTMFIFWKILSHCHVKNNWDHLLQKGKQVLKCFVGTSTTFESYYFERFRENNLTLVQVMWYLNQNPTPSMVDLPNFGALDGKNLVMVSKYNIHAMLWEWSATKL